ncbi:hypothetical protein A3768_4810 (plasmid) [Ralstonia solanacearum]|nr:hypothetical protein A3768_4810 [Ralstonia solanacearum]
MGVQILLAARGENMAHLANPTEAYGQASPKYGSAGRSFAAWATDGFGGLIFQ